MPKPDDFDLIPRNPPTAAPDEPDDDTGSSGDGGGGRDWRWLAALIAVAFLFFAIGAALFTVRERLGNTDAPTPRPATPVPSGTASGILGTLVALASPSQTPRASGTPTRTVTPTMTLTPTPTPCAYGPVAGFAAIYRQDVFGCAVTGGSQTIWAAWEPFERGSMLWRSDTNRSYIFTLGGVWQAINAAWNGEAPPSRGDPPAGLRAPERGFGWAWATDDSIFQAMGWALDAEKGFCAEVQEFDHGFMLMSSAVPSCTAENLYNNATSGDWRTLVLAARLNEDSVSNSNGGQGATQRGEWSGSLGGATVVAAAPTRTITVAARPESQGVTQAHPGAGIQLDGVLSDWPADGWLPIGNVVEGAENYSGSPDAFGVYQAAWTPGGLMIATQVQDDRLRPGPDGTDMWKGDSLEILFDARLAEDASDATASSDDYQIGLSVASDGVMRQYRWLPYGQEGSLPVYGVGSGRDGGYIIEVLLPWTTFGVNGVEAGDTFGFNISVSDNDADAPEQQTVLSASPARTTFNNPTQWGTLVILP